MKEFFKYLLASILGVFISFFIIAVAVFIFLGLIIASFQSTDVKEASANSVMEITLDYQIPERTEYTPFSNFSVIPVGIRERVGLDDIISSIRKAKNDSNIRGIYLDLNNFVAGGISVVEAIRTELNNFKESGKFIIAYGNSISQSAYFLASVADKVFVSPEGDLDFRGLNLELTFLKNTLDKLDIEAQIFRHGTYKGAIEPLQNEKMSEPNREQLTSLLNSAYDHMIGEIALSRNLSPSSVDSIADFALVNTPEDALRFQLVDSVLYYDQVIEILKKHSGIKREKNLNRITLQSYTQVKSSSGPSSQRIAVIYAIGDITRADGDQNTIGIKNISNAIKRAREDDKVKAVVMRVNSPGGDALTSDLIWREVEITREKKPFVVSMGNVAASGGYYISCAADKIFAEPATITGSIGVFGVYPNLQKFFKDKLGITFDGVRTGKYSDMGTVTRPLSPEEKNMVQQQIERIYKTFVTKVSKGRELTFEQVDSVGQGRVWTGLQAKELKLVDEIGGLDDAINEAAKMAKLNNYRIVEYPGIKTIFETVFDDFLQDSQNTYLKWKLGESYRYYELIDKIKWESGIQAKLPYDVSLR